MTSGPFARRRSRLPLFRRVAVAAVVVGAAALCSTGAAAAPPGGTTVSAGGAATVAQAAIGAADAQCANQAPSWATGLPPIPCLSRTPGGPTVYQDYGAILDPVNQGAGKPKIAFGLPVSVARAFTAICSSTTGSNPCPPGLTLPRQDETVTSQYFGVNSDIYAEAAQGSEPEWGAFPSVTVSAYAFGTLPTTVTVTIRQRFENGVAVPLRLAWFTSNGVTPGKKIPGYEQYGEAPPTLPSGQNYFFTPPAHVTGTVDVQVSDVSVDGVSLPVGDSCKASANLDLSSTGGFYESGKAPTFGQPGDYQALSQYGGFLHQGTNIPGYTPNPIDPPQTPLVISPFSGCHNGSENLDALFTGIVSGSDNYVIAYQKGTLKYFGCLGGQTPNCTTQHPPTYFPPDQ